MQRYPILPSVTLALAACGFHPRDDGRPQRVAQDRSGNAYTFGSVEQVEGTPFFTLPILRTNADQGSGSFSGSYRGSDERNRLIVDSRSGASKRVLPNQNFEIVNWIEPTTKASSSVENALVEAGDRDSGDRTTAGVYAAVVKRPGKSDKDPATYDVLLGRFENGQEGWIATGLSGVESIWITPDRKLAMVAATPEGGVYRLYDPKSFHQLIETKLKL